MAKFRFGMLTKDKINVVAEQFREMFFGQYFSVASSWTLETREPRIELRTNRHFRTEHNPEGVKVNNDSIIFSDHSFSYGFDASDDIRNPAFHKDAKGTYVVFEGDTVMFEYRSPSGNLCQIVFGLQGPMELEPDKPVYVQ